MTTGAALPIMRGVCLSKVEGNYPGQTKAALFRTKESGPSRAARPRRWDIGEINQAVWSERDLFVREQGRRWCTDLVKLGSACKVTLSTTRATCLSKFVPQVWEGKSESNHETACSREANGGSREDLFAAGNQPTRPKQKIKNTLPTTRGASL
ncbi:unnamed protein product [Linum trigynum]|uniref:Uncharacterized protein n=1 Tax=Linum trigynum TaxID=586398 RepID=A0AAV2F9D3_9ROSI